MAKIKLNIGEPKSGETTTLEIEDEISEKLYGKKIGEKIKGELFDKKGYEFEITGGSDNAGFPMRRDVDGRQRRKILATKGTGNRANKKGMRLRKTVAGNTVSEETSQLNLKVLKRGKKSLDEEGEEKEEEESKDSEKKEE